MNWTHAYCLSSAWQTSRVFAQQIAWHPNKSRIAEKYIVLQQFRFSIAVTPMFEAARRASTLHQAASRPIHLLPETRNTPGINPLQFRRVHLLECPEPRFVGTSKHFNHVLAEPA